MAITNKLITFNKLTSFETQLAQGNILETSIVFIKDAKKIWTKGTYFDCSGGGSNNIAIYETTDDVYNGVLNDTTYELSSILYNESIYTVIIIQKMVVNYSNVRTFVFNACDRREPGITKTFTCLYSEADARGNTTNLIFYQIAKTEGGGIKLNKQPIALKSDIPNTDDFLQYLDPTLKTIAANGLLGDDEMIYALPNSSIIESEDYDKILATRDEIGYTTEFSVADIEAVYGRGVTKPINVQGLISAIEANKPIIIPTNITDASNVGGNAVTIAKMENDGFIYLNVIVPYLDGVHKEYFIQIKITTAQLIKSGSNGSITLKELVAKTDLKTINGESIVGSGNIEISGGGGSQNEVIELDSALVNISNMLPNVIYYRYPGFVLSVTITSFSTSDSMVDEYTIVGRFGTGSGEDETAIMPITLPENVVWANGTIPIIYESDEFELSITRRGELYKAVLTPFKSV